MAPPEVFIKEDLPGNGVERLRALTGIRAAAALLVVAYHADFMHGYLTGGSYHTPGVRFGWIGVDLFFVLSGLLMGLVYGERLATPSRKAWGYLRDRFLRITPPFYAALLLTLFLQGALSWMWTRPGIVLLNAGYAQVFVYKHVSDISPIFWTLAIEAQFYLLLPLLMPPVRRWPAATLAVLMGWSLLVRWLHYGLPDGVAGLALPAFIGHFALGLAAAQWWRRGKLDLVKRRPDLWAAVGAVLVAAPLLLMLPANSPWQGSQTLAANVAVRPLVGLGFLLILLSLLAERSLLGRLLGLRPFVWLGERSYSLYLTHNAIFFALWQAYPPRTIGYAAYLAIGLLLSLGTAHVFYGLVEQPSLRLRDWLARRKRATGAPAPLPAHGEAVAAASST